MAGTPRTRTTTNAKTKKLKTNTKTKTTRNNKKIKKSPNSNKKRNMGYIVHPTAGGKGLLLFKDVHHFNLGLASAIPDFSHSSTPSSSTTPSSNGKGHNNHHHHHNNNKKNNMDKINTLSSSPNNRGFPFYNNKVYHHNLFSTRFAPKVFVPTRRLFSTSSSSSSSSSSQSPVSKIIDDSELSSFSSIDDLDYSRPRATASSSFSAYEAQNDLRERDEEHRNMELLQRNELQQYQRWNLSSGIVQGDKSSKYHKSNKNNTNHPTFEKQPMVADV